MRRSASPLTLLRAAHPGPAVAVTAFSAALTLAAGGSAGTAVLVALAVAAGQLAIGWANDAVDADRDVAAGRTDKPVATGALARGAVAAAATAAAAAAVPLSLLLGLVPASLHLAGLAAGLAYDLRLKATLASPLPYCVFFGLLPAVAATAAGRSPSLLVCAAGAAVGLAAHFANTVPDAEADAATGVRGLPQRLGPAASRVASALLVLLGAGVLLVGGWADLPVLARALLVLAAATGAVGAASRSRNGFRAVVAAAALCVTGVVASGTSLLPA
ncbi:UbiA family prenyltransferase [Quadrisphaera sp. DSM 44207]|uniref:UbiA family prenyltransferase n=1 Tax=Quadrisphaera sp. DSM 44207 TaxID=1881057 RepID=UPI00088A748F|nr:UbiA family prenyltransferase [Quadrisphaera sp. DSM 44207]SDQ05021.1 4-hydroxybenzoate polyprenyltransferase [Quadrisphaera sp. DSM 44207]